MGLGTATLLSKFLYRVVTNLDGRSAKTKAVQKQWGVEDLPLPQLLEVAIIFLSIAPPAEALSLAQKTEAAIQLPPLNSEKRNLTYIDMNAISPDLARQVGQVIQVSV
jgi:hypothetical protein